MATGTKKRGRTFPQPQKLQAFEIIAVRVEAELRRKLEGIARDEERTLSQLARMALREFVERKVATVAA